jgi:hypothetical protein
MIVVVAVMVGMLSIIVPKLKDLSSLSELSDLYPDFVECLDKACYERNIKNGIVNYWLAKPISMLSKNNLHVVQIISKSKDGNYSLFHWVNSLEWYKRDFEYIIFDPNKRRGIHYYDKAKAIQRFGSPADSFYCGNMNVLVYNRKTDKSFQKQFSVLNKK